MRHQCLLTLVSLCATDLTFDYCGFDDLRDRVVEEAGIDGQYPRLKIFSHQWKPELSRESSFRLFVFSFRSELRHVVFSLNGRGLQPE